MSQTALIWVLAIIFAMQCAVLAIDLTMNRRHNKRKNTNSETQDILCMCTEENKLGTCAEPVRVDAVDPVTTECLHGRTVSSAPTGVTQMVDGIDLCGRERPVFEVKLPPDGKILHLLTPTKAVSDRFQAIGVLLERQEQHRLSMDGMEQLFIFASILLSNNKEGCVFTPADLKERLTAEDIGLLLQSYLVWLTDTIQALN